jgi:hypothetical protein
MREHDFYQPRDFALESRDLFRERDYLRGLAADWISFEMAKLPIIVVKGDLQPREIPPLPENFREALQMNADAIAKLVAEHRDLDACRHALTA